MLKKYNERVFIKKFNKKVSNMKQTLEQAKKKYAGEWIAFALKEYKEKYTCLELQKRPLNGGVINVSNRHK